MQLWDVIVVGAGPAGCAAAYDLSAAGRSVLMVDKAQFPRNKACAGGLTMKAVRALRYSIDPVVRRTVAEIHLEHGSAPGRVLAVRRSKPVCVMTVRAELDAYCLEQTIRRGAVFRRIGRIERLREQADRVVLEVEGATLAARMVLGADGVHSRIRTLLGEAAWFRTGFALEANVPYRATGGREFPLVFDFSPLAGDFSPLAGDFSPLAGVRTPGAAGYGWLFPRNDHVNVGLYTARLNSTGQSRAADSGGGEAGRRSTGSIDRAAIGSLIENSTPERLSPDRPAIHREALSRYIAARCGTGEHDRATGQFLGLGAAEYAPAQGRVLLAGDAAGFVDPLTGEGIYGAIASGQAAASAMLAALARGGAPASRYGTRLARLRGDLSVAERAAQRFYSAPERGFRLMQMPVVRRAVLHSYSEGNSLSTLAGGLRLIRRLV